MDFLTSDFYAPIVLRMQTYNITLSQACNDYIQIILALPSMQRWYKAALEETWRDTGHENEALAAGTVLEDCRKC